MNITGFEKIAPYLTHPLVLVGFVLLLAYGIHWQLMRSGLLRQVSQKDSGLIIRLFLRYGFWLALVLLLAGFGLQFSGIGLSAWNKWMEKEKAVAVKETVVAVNAGKVAEKLYAQLDTKDRQLANQAEQIKSLTEAITALSKADAPAKDINEALRALERGDTKEAKAIFAQVAAANEAVGQQHNKKAAEAYRHLGALAFMEDNGAALSAYHKAVELDPDDMDSWSRLGLTFFFEHELDQAEAAFRRVLAVAEAHQDKKEQALALNMIGSMILIRQGIDIPGSAYIKAQEINESVDKIQIHRELRKVKQMFKRSVKIYKDGLVEPDRMILAYAGLGAVYVILGELDKAEETWKNGSHVSSGEHAEYFQQWLDELAEARTTSTQ